MKSRPAHVPAGPAATPDLAEAPLRTLRALGEHPGSTVKELRLVVGGHANTVRLHLDSLVRLRLAEVVSQAVGPGRPALRYSLTGAGRAVALDDSGVDAEGGLLALVRVLLRDLGSGPAAAAHARGLGEIWGRELAAAHGPCGSPQEGVADVLRSEGYAPEARPEGLTLLRCPMLAAALERPDVVCAVHEGMIAGTAAGLGGDADVRLEPFSVPEGCLARITWK